MEKRQFVINDMLLFEEFCNQRCDYCGGFYPTEYRFRREGDQLIMPPSWEEVRVANSVLRSNLSSPPTIPQLFDVTRRALEAGRRFFEYPILKLSGGEVFIVRETMDFIEELSTDFDAIQVLTNGTYLTEPVVDRIARLGNVYMQISLDGSSLATNLARNKNPRVLGRILDGLDLLQKRQVPVEINCVLTRHNTAEFASFVDYLSQYDSLVVFPRPVRGEPARTLFPDRNQIEAFSEQVDSMDGGVLPPRPYMDRLIYILLNRRRAWDCYIPFFVVGTDMYGNLSMCTLCSNSSRLVGMLEVQSDPFVDSLGQNTYYDPNSKYACCPSGCIVQYEMFNLYVDGEVDDRDLLHVPTFRMRGVLDRTREIKNRIKESKGK